MTDQSTEPAADQLLDLVRRAGTIGPGTAVERAGIELTHVSPDRVVGTMPVEGNRQPYGVLHGGASCVLAETLASVGSAIQAGAGRLAMGGVWRSTRAITGRRATAWSPVRRPRSISAARWRPGRSRSPMARAGGSAPRA